MDREGRFHQSHQVKDSAHKESGKGRTKDRVPFPNCDLDGMEKSNGIQRACRTQPEDAHFLHETSL
jgi:hypothetical protein